jgi:hypothetical protein
LIKPRTTTRKNGAKVMRWSSAFNLSSGRKINAKTSSTQIAQASCQEISARKAALNASGQTSAKAKLTLAQGGRIQGWRLGRHTQTQLPHRDRKGEETPFSIDFHAHRFLARSPRRDLPLEKPRNLATG